jgi:hypothetical protein
MQGETTRTYAIPVIDFSEPLPDGEVEAETTFQRNSSLGKGDERVEASYQKQPNGADRITIYLYQGGCKEYYSFRVVDGTQSALVSSPDNQKQPPVEVMHALVDMGYPPSNAFRHGDRFDLFLSLSWAGGVHLHVFDDYVEYLEENPLLKQMVLSAHEVENTLNALSFLYWREFGSWEGIVGELSDAQDRAKIPEAEAANAGVTQIPEDAFLSDASVVQEKVYDLVRDYGYCDSMHTDARTGGDTFEYRKLGEFSEGVPPHSESPDLFRVLYLSDRGYRSHTFRQTGNTAVIERSENPNTHINYGIAGQFEYRTGVPIENLPPLSLGPLPERLGSAIGGPLLWVVDEWPPAAASLSLALISYFTNIAIILVTYDIVGADTVHRKTDDAISKALDEAGQSQSHTNNIQLPPRLISELQQAIVLSLSDSKRKQIKQRLQDVLPQSL